ncbi:MAG TPA: adenylate/guanylate cyclase domain-containing protein [Candidatus Limnocylindria bacterium]|nr:adenylate/guanylate cyclase domain-containing protein [Candidatus Limnocylindria bacterium]
MPPPPEPPPSDPRNEEFWRKYLEHPDSGFVFGRRVMSHIPSDPRCQMCAAPFTGVGGGLMRIVGKYPSPGNPNMCNTCQRYMIRYHGGAEVDGTMLFADVRGSTPMAEHSSAAEFSALLDRFYTVATRVVYAHSGIVDKFVGDELVAAFPPNLGSDHVRRAIDAGLDLLKATGQGDPAGPWLPVGAAVHTGRVWFGAVGDGASAELTALGDPVNVTARLASVAAAGELLVSTDAAAVVGLDTSGARALELKGKEQPIEVVSLSVGG